MCLVCGGELINVINEEDDTEFAVASGHCEQFRHVLSDVRLPFFEIRRERALVPFSTDLSRYLEMKRRLSCSRGP